MAERSVWPPKAKSTNVLRVTLKTEDNQPVNSATVTLTVKDPQGSVLLNGVAVPFVSNGLYRYKAASSVFQTTGEHKAIWNGTSAGDDWHSEEFFTVIA